MLATFFPPSLQLLLQPGGGPALVGEPFLLTGFIRLPQPTPASASPLTNTTSSSGSASTTGSSGAAQQGTGRASAAAGAAPGTAGSQVLSTSRAASTAGGGAAAAGGLPSCVLEFAVRPLPPTPAPGQPAVPGAGVTLPVTQQHGLLTPGDVTVIVDDRVRGREGVSRVIHKGHTCYKATTTTHSWGRVCCKVASHMTRLGTNLVVPVTPAIMLC
jgi:hypothetical protein